MRWVARARPSALGASTQGRRDRSARDLCVNVVQTPTNFRSDVDLFVLIDGYS